ncbi:hypothetical protein [Sinorhizobium medicae]|uniref:hypothetical protein n=1 Tax=Sinorhizobium medicae TaxID=110321 RepID=UPI001F47FD46|nr:hypothetical protein [Sinorhizobium medicae]
MAARLANPPTAIRRKTIAAAAPFRDTESRFVEGKQAIHGDPLKCQGSIWVGMLINHAALATTAAISQARKVDALEQGLPEFALMRSIGVRFSAIFRSRNPGTLDSWIGDAVNSGSVAIERFARALHSNLDAVYNAIGLPWSNGQPEGQSAV